MPKLLKRLVYLAKQSVPMINVVIPCRKITFKLLFPIIVSNNERTRDRAKGCKILTRARKFWWKDYYLIHRYQLWGLDQPYPFNRESRSLRTILFIIVYCTIKGSNYSRKRVANAKRIADLYGLNSRSKEAASMLWQLQKCDKENNAFISPAHSLSFSVKIFIVSGVVSSA